MATTHTTRESSYVTVELVCGHMTTEHIDTVMDGHELECFACGYSRAWITFRGVNTGYNLRCQDCRYMRSFGPEARLTCQTKAASHAVRKAHNVEVRLDETLLYVSVTSTPSMFDAPPF